MQHIKSFKMFESNNNLAAVQKYLLDKGFYDKAYASTKGDSLVDGVIGKQTIKAIRAYQVKNKLPVTGKVDSKLQSIASGSSKAVNPSTLAKEEEKEEAGFFSKVGEFAGKVGSAAIQTVLNPFEAVVKLGGGALPLHLRGLVHFILGRTDVFDSSDLTDYEEDALYKFCLDRLSQGKTSFDYSYWKANSNGILPTAISQKKVQEEAKQMKSGKNTENMVFPSVAGQYMYFLGATGNGSITKKGDKIIVTDIYDYNEGLTSNLQSMCTGVAEAMNSLSKGKGTTYQVVRKAVAMRHATGYKGYPVRFELNKPS